MHDSWLQAVKDAIPLPAPIVFVLAGLACYLVTCFLARRPLTWGWALVPGLLLSLIIESWEVWDFYGSAGFGGSSVWGIVGRHLKDVALMNAAPVAVLGAATWLQK